MQRQRNGSVVFDKRIRTWNFLWWESGKRRSKQIGTVSEFPTKASAWRGAKELRHALENKSIKPQPTVVTVSTLTERYRIEKMPARHSTASGYNSWLRNRILPKWGSLPITEVKAYPVEQWLQSLDLAPKSKVEIRALIGRLWDFAMLVEYIPVSRNPMELVTVKDASKPTKRRPHCFTAEGFQKFIVELSEPFRTMALIGVTFGLRISETLALRWSDLNWLEGKLNVQRGIVKNRVADTKTANSEQTMTIDAGMLEVLKQWKQITQFSQPEDWVFASPAAIGRLPWSYDQVWRAFLNAGIASGIGRIGTHSMRHTYRSWLDAVGTGLAVQQKLMRHSSISTTMNRYGTVVTNEMATATGKVARLALNGLLADGAHS